MLQLIVDALFGCSHARTTFPLTPRRTKGLIGPRTGTYVVCLDCGREFAYDWKSMTVGAPIAPRSQPPSEPVIDEEFAG